jgi:hypothetical protein
MRQPHDIARVAAKLFNVPLLVLPDVATTIASNLQARFDAPIKGFNRRRSPRRRRWRVSAPYVVVDDVAVIQISGELVNRGSWITAASGLMSYSALTSALRQGKS